MHNKLIDLARTPVEMKRTNLPTEIGSSSRDKYGYGTAITLDVEMLKKLGIKDMPTVGDEYHIMATGKVVSVSQNASETNESSRLEIQLTHLSLSHETDAKEAKETPAMEKKEMYGAGSGGVRFK